MRERSNSFVVAAEHEEGWPAWKVAACPLTSGPDVTLRELNMQGFQVLKGAASEGPLNVTNRRVSVSGPP